MDAKLLPASGSDSMGRPARAAVMLRWLVIALIALIVQPIGTDSNG